MRKETKSEKALKMILNELPEIAVEFDRLIEQDGWKPGTVRITPIKHYTPGSVTVILSKLFDENKNKQFNVLYDERLRWSWSQTILWGNDPKTDKCIQTGLELHLCVFLSEDVRKRIESEIN